MQTHVNPLKTLAALSLLLLAAAPLQQAHGAHLGVLKVTSIENKGGTLRDTPDDDAEQAQDDPDGDPSAAAPDESEPAAANDESSEPADDSEDSTAVGVDADGEDSTNKIENSDDEDDDFDDEDG